MNKINEELHAVSPILDPFKIDDDDRENIYVLYHRLYLKGQNVPTNVPLYACKDKHQIAEVKSAYYVNARYNTKDAAAKLLKSCINSYIIPSVFILCKNLPKDISKQYRDGAILVHNILDLHTDKEIGVRLSFTLGAPPSDMKLAILLNENIKHPQLSIQPLWEPKVNTVTYSGVYSCNIKMEDFPDYQDLPTWLIKIRKHLIKQIEGVFVSWKKEFPLIPDDSQGNARTLPTFALPSKWGDYGENKGK